MIVNCYFHVSYRHMDIWTYNIYTHICIDIYLFTYKHTYIHTYTKYIDWLHTCGHIYILSHDWPTALAHRVDSSPARHAARLRCSDTADDSSWSPARCWLHQPEPKDPGAGQGELRMKILRVLHDLYIYIHIYIFKLFFRCIYI